MKALDAIVCGVSVCLVGATCVLAAPAVQPERPPELKIDSLIDRLAETTEVGYGYSALFSGNQFLPQSDSNVIGSGVYGSPAPRRSAVIEALVRAGAHVVPALLRHLDDQRETRIPPLRGIMWTDFADEYDFNRRTRRDVPQGVNRGLAAQANPSSHAITVGDLCFVALGQIVNRNFNATRHQMTGGLVVSSPTHSKILCEVVRSDFRDFNEDQHRRLLVRDFLEPDDESRRIGAWRRLAFYYPKEAATFVLQQLAVPTYDVLKAQSLVRERLYRERSPAKRLALFEEFVKTHGKASAEGVRMYLFDDLKIQEAQEKGRTFYQPDSQYDARNLLVLLFGYKTDVASAQKPYVNTWSEAELARFIKTLAHEKSVSIDKAVRDILLRDQDNDYLALACMNHLVGKGYDDEIWQCCKRRLGKDENYTKEFYQILSKRGTKPPRER